MQQFSLFHFKKRKNDDPLNRTIILVQMRQEVKRTTNT